MHLSDLQIEALLAQRLTGAELTAALQHLAECEACHARTGNPALDQSKYLAMHLAVHSAIHQALFVETAPAHLSFEHLADWVDGRLAQEALTFADDHLTHCYQCRVAANDLRTFSVQAADRFQLEIKPAVGTVEKSPFWQRWREWIIAPLPLTAAALLSIGLASWLAFQRVTPNVAVLPTTPAVADSPAPTAMPTPEDAASPAVLIAQNQVSLNDGGSVVALDAAGRLQGAADWPVAYRRLAQQTLQGARLQRAASLDGLGTASAGLMGQENQTGFALRDPVGKVIATDRPMLRWRPLAGATSYQIQIVNDEYEIVAQADLLTQTSWQVPQALKRGKIYGWQVKATRGDEIIKTPLPPAPQARFGVLDKKEWAEIQAARKRFGSSHFLLGQLYARAGLLSEAEDEFRALQKANPDSPIPTRLLSEIRKVRSSK